MPNPSLISANTTGFVCIKHATTNQIQKIATTADFQIGLSNVPANLTITGGDLTSHATTFNFLNEPITRTTNIATGAAAQTVTLGSTFVDSSLTLDGESFVALGAYGGPTIQIGSSNAAAVSIDSAGSVAIDATTINLGSTAVARTTNIATGAAAQTVTLGSTFVDSSLTLNAGSSGIIMSSTSTTSADVIIGNIEIGQWPYTTSYCMIGHSTLDHTAAGNYAVLQSSTGDTYLNASSTKALAFRINNVNSGYINASTISLTGGSGVATTVTLGSTTGDSSLTLQAGTGNIKISTDLNSKVGIGNSTPASKLDVATDAAGWAVRIKNDGNDNDRFGLFIQNGSDTAALTNYAVGIHDGDGTNVGYITFSGTTVTYGAFTGDHYAKITDLNTEKAYGIIVKIVNATTIPLGSKRVDYIVAQTTTAKDSAVFGVYSGNFENAPDESMKDYHSIFCLGDGHILVTDDGGNINIGDYICSSNKPGHGMAQDDDILHNYTVAKASAPVDFSNIPNDPIKGFKSVLVACTYHSA